jgi:hypothetical protein
MAELPPSLLQAKMASQARTPELAALQAMASTLARGVMHQRQQEEQQQQQEQEQQQQPSRSCAGPMAQPSSHHHHQGASPPAAASTPGAAPPDVLAAVQSLAQQVAGMQLAMEQRLDHIITRLDALEAAQQRAHALPAGQQV